MVIWEYFTQTKNKDKKPCILHLFLKFWTRALRQILKYVIILTILHWCYSNLPVGDSKVLVVDDWSCTSNYSLLEAGESCSGGPFQEDLRVVGNLSWTSGEYPLETED